MYIIDVHRTDWPHNHKIDIDELYVLEAIASLALNAEISNCTYTPDVYKHNRILVKLSPYVRVLTYL
jgi:hypothetical protein